MKIFKKKEILETINETFKEMGIVLKENNNVTEEETLIKEETDVNKENISENENKKLIKNELDKFNKIINYKL
jgi:hypothetical protein